MIILASDARIDMREEAEARRVYAERQRGEALLDQRNIEHTAAKRVQLWEKLHQLRMPRDPSHQILQLIAGQTGLTLEEVQEVQRGRQPAAA